MDLLVGASPAVSSNRGRGRYRNRDRSVFHSPSDNEQARTGIAARGVVSVGRVHAFDSDSDSDPDAEVSAFCRQRMHHLRPQADWWMRVFGVFFISFHALSASLIAKASPNGLKVGSPGLRARGVRREQDLSAMRAR